LYQIPNIETLIPGQGELGSITVVASQINDSTLNPNGTWTGTVLTGTAADAAIARISEAQTAKNAFDALILANPPAAGQSPQSYGTEIHDKLATIISRDPTLTGVSVEITQNPGGALGQPLTKGDFILDVTFTKGTVAYIVDYKTGASTMSATRITEMTNRMKSLNPSLTDVRVIQITR
jgi:hypothetical protein